MLQFRNGVDTTMIHCCYGDRSSSQLLQTNIIINMQVWKKWWPWGGKP